MTSLVIDDFITQNTLPKTKDSYSV